MFANDYSSRAVCRLGGEGAGERERLVTDAVNRWEVLRQASCGNAGEEAGRGGHGQKGRARPGSAELGWGPPTAPSLADELQGTQTVENGKGAGQMGQAMGVYLGASFT